MIKPYGNNIQIEPVSRNKVIGDTSRFFLYGKVLGVGDSVTKIKVGDTLAYTLWGLNKFEKDSKEYFFLQDNPDYILAIISDET